MDTGACCGMASKLLLPIGSDTAPPLTDEYLILMGAAGLNVCFTGNEAVLGLSGFSDQQLLFTATLADPILADTRVRGACMHCMQRMRQPVHQVSSTLRQDSLLSSRTATCAFDTRSLW